ncbi:MAG TPA: polyphosphate kinase 1, partial [Thermomicrobiales bacterium]|nr:polyphosphate kinase 1 [Thermomicrobiales bacterium]
RKQTYKGNDVPQKSKHRRTSRRERVGSGPLLAPELYLNRELSWLEFNRRVLEEALDTRNPLLERVKFLSIFSSNLDEFFMVRVAGIVGQVRAGDDSVGRDGTRPSEQVAAIKLLVSDLSACQRECWNTIIKPALRDEGILIEEYDGLSSRDRRGLTRYFERQIFPVLTPLAVDAGHPFPHISNLSLNMLILIEDERGEHIARLKIPSTLPRFIQIPEPDGTITVAPRRKLRYVVLEDVIEANVDQLFPGKQIKSTHLFRVTRDADIEVVTGSGDSLLKTIEDELEQRLFGYVVRLTVEPSMPEDTRQWLADKLNAAPDNVYVLSRPHGLSDLMQLYSIDQPALKDKPFIPRYPSVLRESDSIFSAIRNGDVLLYHPYDSFTPVVDFVRQAAADTDVVALKQTLYRVGNHSPIVDALLEARDDDTQIAVLLELRARFDEESNINWARALESEGVHVAYGLAGIKTHCKIAMAVRREGDTLRRYVHLGTGNYNVATSRTYTDIGVMTCDEDIAADVSDVFNYLTGYSAQSEYRKLLVAPVNLRSEMLNLIEREMSYGEKGRIIMKMNSLSDYQMAEALYRAAQAGVKVDLIVRGICVLRPGVEGISENIRVVSIVGRFLEHVRLFYFKHGRGDNGEAMYAGSADLMRRNLDYRVEVLFPVEDARIRGWLRDGILELQLRDNVRARLLQRDGSYVRLTPKDGQEPIDSQEFHLSYEPSAAAQAFIDARREPA